MTSIVHGGVHGPGEQLLEAEAEGTLEALPETQVAPPLDTAGYGRVAWMKALRKVFTSPDTGPDFSEFSPSSRAYVLWL